MTTDTEKLVALGDLMLEMGHYCRGELILEAANELDRLRAELTQTQAKAEKLAEVLNLAANRLVRCAVGRQKCGRLTRQALTEWSAK